MCDMTHSQVRHDPCIHNTHLYYILLFQTLFRVTCLIHMCDMMYSYVWHDPFSHSTHSQNILLSPPPCSLFFLKFTPAPHAIEGNDTGALCVCVCLCVFVYVCTYVRVYVCTCVRVCVKWFEGYYIDTKEEVKVIEIEYSNWRRMSAVCWILQWFKGRRQSDWNKVQELEKYAAVI